jgi:outer membrane protein TolC
MQLGAQQLVRLEVQQALGDLAEARVRADRYAKQTAIGKQLATQAGVAFDSGLGEARELLEDTLLYARADGERLKALFDAQVAWAALEKASGGPLGP